MAANTVLVAGGTGGIGRATAEGLARLGARVGIVGRDLTRVPSVAADISATCGSAAVDGCAADMTSLAEVRRLSGEVLTAYPRLAVLVNNVGGFWGGSQNAHSTPQQRRGRAEDARSWSALALP
jgi:NAD(P)-dependent dehydrogenase (short-subunit alcohol dehydrogenase family)